MNTPVTPWIQAKLPQAMPGNHLPWLRQARKTALERCVTQGLPTTRDEEWKYTDVSAIGRRANLTPGLTPGKTKLDAAISAALPEWLLQQENTALLVFVNGHYQPGLSNLGALPQGVRLHNLSQQIDFAPAMLQPFLGNELMDGGSVAQNVFDSLNAAFATDGAVLHLSSGIKLAAPIYLLCIAHGEGAAIYPRHVIVAEEGAQATVIEHYVGTAGAANFTDALTQISLGAGAELEHYKLLEEDGAAYHIGGIHARQAAGSRFASHSFVVGGRLSRNQITTLLAEEGGECLFNGLYLASGRQHIDHHTRIEHAAPGCTSRQYYRGILDGAGRGVFNGKVIVQQGAMKTDAHQANNTLLLSRQAEMDTKPQLEIFADDVKCTHGATVGPLDEDTLFYLRSRGIDAVLAKALLGYGFAHDVIDRVSLPALRARLEKILLARLPQGAMLEELL
jgi:Fe-S cluster assembly protein SufD